jgi:hypothetical protein
MSPTRKTLSIHEYRKLKAEEGQQPLLSTEKEALSGYPSHSNTFTEEEEGPSLQVDYEDSDNESLFHKSLLKKNIPIVDDSSENAAPDDTSREHKAFRHSMKTKHSVDKYTS